MTTVITLETKYAAKTDTGSLPLFVNVLSDIVGSKYWCAKHFKFYICLGRIILYTEH